MSGACYNWSSCSEDRGATHNLGESSPQIWVLARGWKWSEFRQVEKKHNFKEEMNMYSSISQDDVNKYSIKRDRRSFVFKD